MDNAEGIRCTLTMNGSGLPNGASATGRVRSRVRGIRRRPGQSCAEAAAMPAGWTGRDAMCGTWSGPSVERRRTGEQFVPAGAVDDPLADIGEAVRILDAEEQRGQPLRRPGAEPPRRQTDQQRPLSFRSPFRSPLGVAFGPGLLPLHAQPGRVVGTSPLPCSQRPSHAAQYPAGLLRQRLFVQCGVDLLRRPSWKRPASSPSVVVGRSFAFFQLVQDQVGQRVVHGVPEGGVELAVHRR